MNLLRIAVALLAARMAGLGFESHNYSAALPWCVISVAAVLLFIFGDWLDK